MRYWIYSDVSKKICRLTDCETEKKAKKWLRKKMWYWSYQWRRRFKRIPSEIKTTQEATKYIHMWSKEKKMFLLSIEKIPEVVDEYALSEVILL